MAKTYITVPDDGTSMLFQFIGAQIYSVATFDVTPKRLPPMRVC